MEFRITSTTDNKNLGAVLSFKTLKKGQKLLLNNILDKPLVVVNLNGKYLTLQNVHYTVQALRIK
jgi:hypothetical protein